MRSKVIIGVVAAAGFIALAVSIASGMAGTKQSALVYLQRPTMIAGKIVSGTVVFAHDDERMARGEPCTTVYQYVRGGQGQMLVEFMCTPTKAEPTKAFTARCSRALGSGPDVLNEYQFSGENEAHGVPWRP